MTQLKKSKNWGYLKITKKKMVQGKEYETLKDNRLIKSDETQLNEAYKDAKEKPFAELLANAGENQGYS